MEDDFKVVVGIRLASLPFRPSKWIISEWLNSVLICDFLTVKVVNSAAFHCGYALSYSSFSMFMVILIFITTIIFNLKPENNDCS
jgi:hypothetical protein